MILEEIKPLEGYELIDSGNGSRLERFGAYTLERPDPAVLWLPSAPESVWENADASYALQRSKPLDISGNLSDNAEGENVADDQTRGKWNIRTSIPEKWEMKHAHAGVEVKFFAKLTPFKHTGVFPEQVANWDFIIDHAPARVPGERKLLNLFGYTGIASAVASKAGFKVTHVDASKPSIEWAKENMLASGLPEDAIRWIYDDVLKFVKREVKRGQKYNAILFDPPAFGRGPKGEVWKFNEALPELLLALEQIIDPENFDFVIANAYAVSVSSLLLKSLMEDFAVRAKLGKRQVDYGELVIKQSAAKPEAERLLSTGIFARLY